MELATEKAQQMEQVAKEADKRTKEFAEEKQQLVMGLTDYFSRVVKEGIDQCVADLCKPQIDPGAAADDTP